MAAELLGDPEHLARTDTKPDDRIWTTTDDVQADTEPDDRIWTTTDDVQADTGAEMQSALQPKASQPPIPVVYPGWTLRTPQSQNGED